MRVTARIGGIRQGPAPLSGTCLLTCFFFPDEADVLGDDADGGVDVVPDVGGGDVLSQAPDHHSVVGRRLGEIPPNPPGAPIILITAEIAFENDHRKFYGRYNKKDVKCFNIDWLARKNKEN